MAEQHKDRCRFRTCSPPDPGTGAPLALYTSATSAEWDGDDLRFDDGTVLRDGILVADDGVPVDITRPLQLFTRWYGWALMYPDTEIRER